MSDEQVVDVSENVKAELDVFLPEDDYTTAFGEEIKLPKITWKKEKVIFKRVGELFDSVEELKDINLNEFTSSQILTLVAVMLREAPDVITTLAAEITDLTEEEVENRLDSTDLVRLLVPFFSGRVQMVMKVFQETLSLSAE